MSFQIFTAGIARWWPLASNSVFRDDAVMCVFEARAGGRIYERNKAGGEALWGTVLISEPGHRVVCAWHPGRSPTTAQELRILFVASQGGTRVELEHVGWETLGARAEETRALYDSGWDDVLGTHFAAAANHC